MTRSFSKNPPLLFLLSMFLKIKFQLYFDMTTLQRLFSALHAEHGAVKYPQKCRQCCVSFRANDQLRSSALKICWEKFTKHGCRRFLCFRLFLPSPSFMLPLSPGCPPPLHRHNTVFLNPGLGVVIRGGFTKKGAQTTSQQLTRGKTSITKIQLPPLQKKTKHNTHQQISSISDGFKKKKACTWFLFFFFLVCRAVVQKRKHRQLLVLFRKRRGLKLNTPK